MKVLSSSALNIFSKTFLFSHHQKEDNRCSPSPSNPRGNRSTQPVTTEAGSRTFTQKLWGPEGPLQLKGAKCERTRFLLGSQ